MRYSMTHTRDARPARRRAALFAGGWHARTRGERAAPQGAKRRSPAPSSRAGAGTRYGAEPRTSWPLAHSPPVARRPATLPPSKSGSDGPTPTKRTHARPRRPPPPRRRVLAPLAPVPPPVAIPGPVRFRPSPASAPHRTPGPSPRRSPPRPRPRERPSSAFAPAAPVGGAGRPASRGDSECARRAD